MKNFVNTLCIFTTCIGLTFSLPAQAQAVANTSSTFKQFNLPELAPENTCSAGVIYSSDGSMAPKPFAEAIIVCRTAKDATTAKWVVHVANDAFIAGRSKGAVIELPANAQASLGKNCKFDQAWSCQEFGKITKFSLVLANDPDFMDEEKDFKYLAVNTGAKTVTAPAGEKVELGALKGALLPPDDFPSCEYRSGRKLIARDSFQEPATNGLILNLRGEDVFVPVKETGNKMNPTLVGQIGNTAIVATPGKPRSSGRGSESSSATPIKFSVTPEKGATTNVDALRQCGPS